MPVFSDQTILRIANIFDNAGQVFFAVTVLAPIVQGLAKINWAMVTFGLSTTLALWVISVTLTTRVKK